MVLSSSKSLDTVYASRMIRRIDVRISIEVAVEKIETVRVPKKKRSEKVHKDSDKEDLDHSKKLKRVKTMFETAKFLMEMKKAKKASKD
ncbi:hypothetical protein Tco_0791969 [Tanacetum coccineum]